MPEIKPLADKPTYAVVYQFGKVASTSIVAALNLLPDVEAVQSHFMGKQALGQILDSLFAPGMSEYFYFHQRGQLVENIDITRKVTQLRAGLDTDQNLLILSMCRDPMDWFRSALTQDAKAHLETMKTYLAQIGQTVPEDGDAVIRAALPAMLDEISTLFSTSDTFWDISVQSRASAAEIKEGLTPALVLFTYLVLRPFNWYRTHFQSALGVGIGELSARDGLWLRQDEGETIAVLRYEDMAQQLPGLIAGLGLGDIDLGVSENRSTGKLHADTIREVLDAYDDSRLREVFARSYYSRFFGY
ncbi:hypothetical protein AB0T83_14895 [Fluviibacterium sp. DFM31]|uniref:Sulfotransferase domain-containing protein n=1 Tax=Meridianimarinicoccus marinus TaxID=3231483 RepID=A0ABV3LAJ3_9RHOB